jgi:PAS domain S-box-containing protein
MKLFRSLKNQLPLYFAAVAVAPLLVFGVSFSVLLTRHTTETALHELETYTAEIVRGSQSYLNAASREIDLVIEVLEAGLVSHPDHVATLLRAASAHSEVLTTLLLLDQHYKVVNFVLPDELATQQKDYFGLDFSGHEFFREGRVLNQASWSNTFSSPITGEPAVFLGAPVRKGFLLAPLSLNHVEPFKKYSGDRRSQMEIAIVDRNGILVEHSRPELARQRISMLDHPEMVSAVKHGMETPARIDDQALMLVCTRIIPETGWVVRVSIPKSAALAQVSSFNRLLSVCSGGAVFVGLLFAFWFSTRFVRPLMSLRDKTSEIAEGRYALDLPVYDFLELNVFAEHFKTMAGAIKDREVQLSKAKTRYADLVNSIDGIVWELDPAKSAYNFVSRQIEKMFGYPADRWLNEEGFWQKCIHPEERDLVSAYRFSHAAAGLDHEQEYRIVGADGNVIWVKELVNVVGTKGRQSLLRGIMIDVTAHRQAEKALRDSEERFRTVFRISPEPMLLTSLPNGLIVDVNHHCEILSGHDREAMIGQTTLDLDFWVDPEVRAHYMETIAETGRVDSFEANLRRKDGEIRCCLISACIISLQDDNYLLASVHDITEQRQVENLLRQSESRFRSLVEVMGEGVVIQDRQGVIVDCNAAAERILGVTAKACRSRSFDSPEWAMFQEDGSLISPVEFPSQITLRTGQPVANHILGIKHLGGKTAWLQINSQPLELDREGLPDAVVMTFADVTRHIENEEFLRAGEERYRLLSRQFQALLETIPYRIDLRGNNLAVLWSNAAEISAEDRQKLPPCGFRCSPANQGTYSCCSDCPTARCYATMQHQEALLPGRQGSTWHLRAFPVLDDDGQLSQVIQMVEDVTERVLREQQEIRTGQLAALGELAAGVAHEINNPINGIINYGQLILNRAAEEGREKDLAERIIKEGERIATIVRDLLHFAREESPELRVVSLHEVFEDTLALVGSHLRKEGVLLKMDLQEGLPPIASRAHQIQQAFLNVISNARHALAAKYPDPNPDKILEIRAEQVTVSGREMVRCTFTDHGTGMSKDLLKRVLNPFVTTKPAGVGTGLGLSISHEIVKNHGGSIDITSQNGKFTRVRIDLPAMQ